MNEQEHLLMLTDDEAAAIRVAIVTYLHADTTEPGEQWITPARAVFTRLNESPERWSSS